ncbi:MAG TPA: polysaccharide deacetylase family protein [Phnomibacter sp.]|nr:polysaccharide deacetylase family protein [Phnomibacter sp.]
MSLNAFTVDVEDWYQGVLPYAQWNGHETRLNKGLDILLALLDHQQVKGTFFILGAAAEQYPHLIKKLAAAGHQLGSHSYTHEYVYKQTPEAFRQEIRRTKKIVEDLTGIVCTCHRSPFFSITAKSLWALDILAEEGFTLDSSINPVKTWIYGISTSPQVPYRIAENGLIQFPLSPMSILGKKVGIGGAYFRLFPYLLTHMGMRRRQKQGLPNNFYIHPWEYDAQHPRIPMQDKGIRFGHYVRLGSTAPNTRRLLQQFEFTTLQKVLDNYLKYNTLATVSVQQLARG